MKYRLPLVCASFLALTACSSDDDTREAALGEAPRFPVPGCEHLDHTPCDTLVTECQTRVLELAACLRGDDPGALPAITVIDQERYADRLTLLGRAQTLGVRSITEPIYYERALELLGLVEPAAFAPDEVVTRRVERVYGTYDSETDAILMIDHGEPADDPLSNRILLHEFIHALQDRTVDLSAYYEEHVVDYDSSLAASAVVEGEARLHESRFGASLLGIDPGAVDWRRRFDEVIAYSDERILEQPSPYVFSHTVVAYDYGARFVHHAWAEGGLRSVLELFASPPTSTQVLMASTDALAEPPQVVAPAAPIAPAEYNLMAATTLGAWTFYLVLAKVLERTVPSLLTSEVEFVRELALAWRGDTLFVYTNTDPITTYDPSSAAPVTVLVWKIELKDQASATAAGTRLREVFGDRALGGMGTLITVSLSDRYVPLGWAFYP